MNYRKRRDLQRRAHDCWPLLCCGEPPRGWRPLWEPVCWAAAEKLALGIVQNRSSELCLTTKHNPWLVSGIPFCCFIWSRNVFLFQNFLQNQYRLKAVQGFGMNSQALSCTNSFWEQIHGIPGRENCLTINILISPTCLLPTALQKPFSMRRKHFPQVFHGLLVIRLVLFIGQAKNFSFD